MTAFRLLARYARRAGAFAALSFTAFLFTACALVTPAWAQAPGESEFDSLLVASLENLMSMTVSIAAQTPQTLSKAPSVVSLITAEDIRASGATNLMDVLQGVPGIYIRHNQFGDRPLISFRGSAGTHALLMVDGAPQRDLVWSSGIFWKGLPVSMIERVEIIRGPGSVLFGSDASAGVINVITRTAGKMLGSEAGVRLGSFDSQTAWLQHGRQWQGYDIGLTLEASTTDGHRPWIAADRQSRNGLLSYAPDHAEFGYDNLDLRFSIARDHWRVQADHMEKNNFAIGFTGAGILDPYTRAEDRHSSLGLLYSNADIAPHWGLDAELRYREMAYSSGNGFWEMPGSNLNRMESAERRVNAEASGVYRGMAGHSVRIGGGAVWQDLYAMTQTLDGVPALFVPEKMRRNTYLFAQDVWQLAREWELTAGARYDHYDTFGGAFTPRLALVWETTPQLTSKLLYGKAFRVPSYLELYALTSATIANPDLVPEKTDTWDLAFSYTPNRDLKLGLNLFRYAQRNPIIDLAGKFVHGAPQTIRGVEMETLWQASNTVRLAGNLTRRWQEFCANPLYYAVPQEEAYLRIDWAFQPKWRWNLQANWIGKRHQALTDTRTPLGAQTTADTTLRYFHGSEWEFAASIRNLLNAEVFEYTGTSIPNYLPLPRRSAFVEARFKF